MLCVSKSNPEYAMCVKIIVNEGPYAYCDFEILNMPVDADGEVHDTCIALEYEDDLAGLATFFAVEMETLIQDLYEWEDSMSVTNEISYIS